MMKLNTIRIMTGLVTGGRVEGHGYEAFGHGKGADDSGTLKLGVNVYAGDGDRIFPYEERYIQARKADAYLIKR